MQKPSRPSNIAALRDMMSRFRSPESRAAGLAIDVRPSDVFIATYPKSGTTWAQHIAHGLRSGGSMDFDEICEVVPWLESALDMGQDPNADQHWEPRLFKVHLNGDEVPSGGRYVLAVRDPKAVVVSFHRFFDGTYFEAGAIDLETFAREWFIGGTVSGRYWGHLKSWWPKVGRPDTLAMAYEDMVADHRGTVVRFAEFLGAGVDEGVIDVVVHQSSRGFMTSHGHQFDDHLLFAAMHETWGLPAGGNASKVKRSRSDPARLSPALEAEFDDVWRSEIEPELGFSSYEELRAALRAVG
jgi:hypothetical protein